MSLATHVPRQSACKEFFRYGRAKSFSSIKSMVALSKDMIDQAMENSTSPWQELPNWQNFCAWWLVWKAEIFEIRSCSWTCSSQLGPPAAWQLLRSHQSNIGPAANLPKSQHKDLSFYDKFKTSLGSSESVIWSKLMSLPCRAVAAQDVFFMCLFSDKNRSEVIYAFLKMASCGLIHVEFGIKRKILNNMIFVWALPATPRTVHSQVPLASSIFYEL